MGPIASRGSGGGHPGDPPILQEHPDYSWGQAQLATWACRAGRPRESLVASQRLVASSPEVSAVHLVLADALFESGHRVAALGALERAVALAPGDEQAIGALFDAALEEGEIGRAEVLLPLLRSARSASAAAAETRLAARRGDVDAAIERLGALARDPTVDAVTFEQARRACIFAGLSDRCDALLRGSSTTPRPTRASARRGPGRGSWRATSPA